MSDPPAFDDAQIKYLDENYGGASSQNVHWMIFNGVLVFLMQCGFAMLCAGSVRAKNAQNILLKNLVDTCVGAMGFWATGYVRAPPEPEVGRQPLRPGHGRPGLPDLPRPDNDDA